MRIPLSELKFYRTGADIPLRIINSSRNAFEGVTVDSEEQSFCIETEHLEIDFDDYIESITSYRDEDRFDDLNAKYLSLWEAHDALKAYAQTLEDLARCE